MLLLVLTLAMIWSRPLRSMHESWWYAYSSTCQPSQTRHLLPKQIRSGAKNMISGGADDKDKNNPFWDVTYKYSAKIHDSKAEKEMWVYIRPYNRRMFQQVVTNHSKPSTNLYNTQEIGRAKMIWSKPNNVRYTLFVCHKMNNPATTHAATDNNVSIALARWISRI